MFNPAPEKAGAFLNQWAPNAPLTLAANLLDADPSLSGWTFEKFEAGAKFINDADVVAPNKTVDACLTFYGKLEALVADTLSGATQAATGATEEAPQMATDDLETYTMMVRLICPRLGIKMDESVKEKEIDIDPRLDIFQLNKIVTEFWKCMPKKTFLILSRLSEIRSTH